MKNLRWFSLFVFAICCNEVTAQIEKGTQFWGGTINANGRLQSGKEIAGTSSGSKSNHHSVGLGIQWGTFVKQNTMIGAEVSGNLWVQKGGSPNLELKQRQHTYGFSPFLRWYKPVFKDLYIFAGPSLGVFFSGHRSRTFLNGAETNVSSGNSFSGRLGVTPGISYRIGNRFAIESDLNLFSLGLNYSGNGDNRGISFSSSVSSGITNDFGLRAAFYLN